MGKQPSRFGHATRLCILLLSTFKQLSGVLGQTGFNGQFSPHHFAGGNFYTAQQEPMRKILRCTLLPVLFVGMAVTSVKAQEEIMWKANRYGKTAIAKDVVYKTLTDGRRLGFDFYRAAGAVNLPQPLVVIMNGFGDSALKGKSVQTEWAKLVAGDGLSALTFTSHAEDVEGDFDDLIAYLNKNAGRYSFNGDFLVMAFSGNVTKGLPLVTDPKRKNIKGAVVYYGRGKVTAYRQDMPLLFVRAGLDNAALNRNIDTLLFQALAHNAPWTIINHPSGTHPFEFGPADGQSIEVIGQTLRFLHASLSTAVRQSIVNKEADAAAGTALYTKDWSLAVALYEKMAKEKPYDAETFFRLGSAYFGLGEDAKALTAFDKALGAGYGKLRDLSLPASMAAARLKDADLALKWLGVLAGTPGGLPYIKASGDYRFLEENERYRKIVGPK